MGLLVCCSPQCRGQNLGVLPPHGHSPYEKRKGKYCLHASMTQFFPFLFSHCSLLSWKLYHTPINLQLFFASAFVTGSRGEVIMERERFLYKEKTGYRRMEDWNGEQKENFAEGAGKTNGGGEFRRITKVNDKVYAGCGRPQQL